MGDLIDELDEMGEVDDDNFIYIDEHGKLELKQEIVFKWTGFLSKKIHITCSALYCLCSDSINYIKTLLHVAMEKYSIFLGLKDLRIIKLSNPKELLPEVSYK